MFELRIAGSGTKDDPISVNGQEATLLKLENASLQEGRDTTCRWSLQDGGETTWTLEKNGESHGPAKSYGSRTRILPVSREHIKYSIQKHLDRLAAHRDEVKSILLCGKIVSAAGKHHLKPRTETLNAVLDSIEKQLSQLQRRFQHKRKAQSL